MNVRIVTLSLLAFGIPAAFAVTRINAAPAFPALPCPDGWAGCMVGGTVVNPDMRPDSEGVLEASDLRIGWFDLKGTAALSPFVKLSDYSTAAVPAHMAAVQPRTAPPPANDPEPGANADAGSTTDAATASNAGAPSSGVVTGTGMVTSVAPSSAASGPAGSSSSGASSGSTTGTAATSQEALSSPGGSPTGSGGCDDLVALEPSALMGQLSAPQKSCLESRVASSRRQTEKDKISRVLLTDADARGDRKAWMELARRHLEEIDRSDPDLCMTYASRLAQGGSDRANGVIRWADVALENKQVWSGATYTSRVIGLFKLRAEAANKLWQAAEAAYVENRTEANEASSTKYRNMTKDYAREWLDYAKASGQNSKNALALCVSAAGNKEYCGGG